MSWLNNSPFSISEAAQRGYDVYEVLYRDWGIGDDTPGNSGIVPADRWPPTPLESIPISVAGIAIGPRSTVDRAWLTYNLLKAPPPPGIGTSSGATLPPNYTIPPSLAPFTSRIRQISLEAPLLFTQTAQTGANVVTTLLNVELGTMLVNGSMYVWPQGANADFAPFVGGSTGGEAYAPQEATTRYIASFFDVNGVSRPLGPYVPGAQIGQTGWVGPLLHLYFFLKAPLVSPPTKRAPLKVSSVVNLTAGGLFGIETPVAQIAVFGRRSVRVMVMADQLCDFRVGALRTPVSISFAQEEPVDSALAVPKNTPTILSKCSGCDFYADYLTIYATPQDVAHSQPNIIYNVTAQD